MYGCSKDDAAIQELNQSPLVEVLSTNHWPAQEEVDDCVGGGHDLSLRSRIEHRGKTNCTETSDTISGTGGVLRQLIWTTDDTNHHVNIHAA